MNRVSITAIGKLLLQAVIGSAIMRGLACALAALIALLPISAAAQTWHTYGSNKFGFRIEIPGKPKKKTEQVKFNGRIIKVTEATANYKKQDFSVQYGDYKADANLDQLLPYIEKGLGAKGSETQLTLNGVPGREVTVNVEGFHTIFRMFIVDGRRIMFGVSSPESLEADPVAQRFLRSFMLVRKSP